MGFSRQEYWSGVPLPSPALDTSLIQFYSIFLMRKLRLRSCGRYHVISPRCPFNEQLVAPVAKSTFCRHISPFSLLGHLGCRQLPHPKLHPFSVCWNLHVPLEPIVYISSQYHIEWQHFFIILFIIWEWGLCWVFDAVGALFLLQ